MATKPALLLLLLLSLLHKASSFSCVFPVFPYKASIFLTKLYTSFTQVKSCEVCSIEEEVQVVR